MTPASTASGGSFRVERVVAGAAAVAVAAALSAGMVATATPGRQPLLGWLAAIAGVSLGVALAGWVPAVGVTAVSLAGGWLWALADVGGPATIVTVVGAGLYLLVEQVCWAGPLRHRGGGTAVARLARMAAIVLVGVIFGAAALAVEPSPPEGRAAIVGGLAAVVALGAALITLLHRALRS